MYVVDMHCDTISELYSNHKEGGREGLRKNHFHVDLEKMKLGDYLLQNFALFVHMGGETDPFTYCMGLVDLFYQELEDNQDLIAPIRSYHDIEENQNKGLLSAMLTIEEGGVCKGDLRLLRDFYRLGVRMMTLTWNFANEIGHPNHVDLTTGKFVPNITDGLTETGIEFVREMERLGMIIDVSHLSDAGIRDVFKYTNKPFVASHSNSRSICSHPRNLTDDMVRALAERGGVAGINFCSSFIDQQEDESLCRSTVQKMAEHISHLKQVGGIGCIGLGTDFDGISGHGLEITSAAGMPMLEQELRRQGFTQTEIEAIFYKNVLRVYSEILK